MASQQYFQPHARRRFESYVGQWINLDTTFGSFQGMVEQVSHNAVLLKMPASSMSQLTSATSNQHDVTLAGYYPEPYRGGSWCWCWFPLIFILFIPFFCW